MVFDLMGPMASLLIALAPTDPTIYIAGGALRDWENGRGAKDIDVWSTHDYPVSQALIDLGYIPDVVESNIEYDREPEVTGSTTYRSPGQLPVNLIGLASYKPIPEALARFDFGICQIGMGVDGKVIRTPIYNLDKEKHQFTLTRCRSHEDYLRSKSRYDRIGQRYRGWKLVIPPHCAQFTEPEEIPF